MKLNKWNYELHKYEEYEVPDDWNIKLIADDMEELVNCPHCGKQMAYGTSFTSLEIHNYIGFGFPVCEECYAKEWERRRKYRED